MEWLDFVSEKLLGEKLHTCHLEAITYQDGMCSSGMLAGGDQTVITHSINA